MTADAPGPLLASGRDADVFDIGGGRVVRRYRQQKDSTQEAVTMAHLAERGYPVPVVHEATGADLVMERIEGPTMLGRLGRRPWEMRRQARVLAGLHQQLASVPRGDLDLPGSGERRGVIVHGDLHPDNVIISPSGPVVIDWPNARIGPEGTDTAEVWVLLHAAEAPGTGRSDRIVESLGRGMLLRSFLTASDEGLARRALPQVIERRRRDPNLSDAEKHKMAELLTSASQ